MEITIESTFLPGWNYTVRYDPETWMKMHYIEIPDARGQVKAKAKGTGYAVMMVSFANIHGSQNNTTWNFGDIFLYCSTAP